LRKTPAELYLAIADSGVGFDPASAASQQGLGLVSMQERAKLVHGTVVIDSKPMGGTTIHVRVPLCPDLAAESLNEASSI
jgi:signal transduction histidine kinase